MKKIAIKKLFSKEDEPEKIVTKSIRLRKEADKALQILAEKSGNSQNETLNIILEESYREYEFFEIIEEYWKKNPYDKVILSKIIKFGELKTNIEWFYILAQENSKIRCTMRIQYKDWKTTGRLSDVTEIFAGGFMVNTLTDLLNSGVDYSFAISFESEKRDFEKD